MSRTKRAGIWGSLAVIALLFAGRVDAQTCCQCRTCNPDVCFTTIADVAACNDTCLAFCGLPVSSAFGAGACGGSVFPDCAVIDPATPTPTSTRTSTPTRTVTATFTESSHGRPAGAPCTTDGQCASGLCSNGFCAGTSPAPAASNLLLLLIGAAMLLLGWWSSRRGTQRR